MTEDVLAAEGIEPQDLDEAKELDEEETLPEKGTAEWYNMVARLMQYRDHCGKMITKWQSKTVETERLIHELTGEPQSY
jgi:hypothetical protein